jgi:hypothetical protein
MPRCWSGGIPSAATVTGWHGLCSTTGSASVAHPATVEFPYPAQTRTVGVTEHFPAPPFGPSLQGTERRDLSIPGRGVRVAPALLDAERGSRGDRAGERVCRLLTRANAAVPVSVTALPHGQQPTCRRRAGLRAELLRACYRSLRMLVQQRSLLTSSRCVTDQPWLALRPRAGGGTVVQQALSACCRGGGASNDAGALGSDGATWGGYWVPPSSRLTI